MSDINEQPEMESLRSEKRRISKAVMRCREERYGLFYVNKHRIRFHPKAAFIMYWVIDLVIVLFTVSIAVSFSGKVTIELMLVLVFLAIVIAVVNIAAVYPRVRRIRELDAEISRLNAEFRKIDEELKSLEAEMNKHP